MEVSESTVIASVLLLLQSSHAAVKKWVCFFRLSAANKTRWCRTAWSHGQ